MFKYLNLKDMKRFLTIALMLFVSNFSNANTANGPLIIKDFGVKLLPDNTLEVSWVSIIESNTKNYIIEYSIDGFQFDSITNQLPLHKDDLNRHYVKNINNLNINAKHITYYRLKIINNLGVKQYSPIVNINPIVISPSIIDIYPNPMQSNHDVFIDVSIKTFDPIEVEIYRFNGRIVKSFVLNNLTLTHNIAEHTSTLNQGCYIVYLKISGITYFKQIIVH
jgi:hypothetical protein